MIWDHAYGSICYQLLPTWVQFSDCLTLQLSGCLTRLCLAPLSLICHLISLAPCMVLYLDTSWMPRPSQGLHWECWHTTCQGCRSLWYSSIQILWHWCTNWSHLPCTCHLPIFVWPALRWQQADNMTAALSALAQESRPMWVKPNARITLSHEAIGGMILDCIPLIAFLFHLSSGCLKLVPVWHWNPFYFVAIFSKVVSCVTAGIMRIYQYFN